MRNAVLRPAAAIFLLCGAANLFARSTGAPAGHTGAPGDAVCTACHAGTANTGPGKVALSFANTDSYRPGQTQRVTVTITDPNGRRWGFQVSPRITKDEGKTGAGTLASTDGNTQVLPASGTLQWITHTSAGTRNGTTGPTTFEFDWTAPATDVGDIDFYVAANAANGGGTNQGDSVYTSKATLRAAAASGAKPTISEAGVVNGASFKTGIASGSWITISGENLATATRIWDDKKEIVDGKLPTALDGTRVTVNGKPAAVYYISPKQINVQAPDDLATGNVNVVVTTNAGDSTPAVASVQQFSPAFFVFDPQNRNYAAAVISSTVYVGPAGLFGTALTTRPAKPGETILLFGTGFGPTNPAVRSGEVFSGSARLTNSVAVTIGGVAADVAFAGLSGAGLYQFNVTVPAGVPDGDQPVLATINSVQSQAGIFIAVQR